MLTDDPNFEKYAKRLKPKLKPETESIKETMLMGAKKSAFSAAVEEPEKSEESLELFEEELMKPDKDRERLDDYLFGLLDRTSSGFTVVLIMYIIAFAIGIGLIITAVILHLNVKPPDNYDLMSIFFGTAGTADIVLLMYKPAREIQRSRANASRLAATISDWFSISRNLDTTYKLLMIKGDITNDFDTLKEIAVLRKTITAFLIKQMGNSLDTTMPPEEDIENKKDE
ncbi:MAG: hypothetical protein OEQ12_07790 [Nitrosopumilus sp.]|nr:hypothetical protein [Nitrosopumilus sp.]